jgi:hypothetical protein
MITPTHHDLAAPLPETHQPPRRRRWAVLAAVGLLAATGTAVWVSHGDAPPPAATASEVGTTTAQGPTSTDATAAPTLQAQLTYLAEEEKLAHDVYVLSESIYGTRTYANISRSETQHQESVLSLLAARDLPDPTLGNAAGVFTDPSLQALYDELASRVRASAAEAAKVGILIEQTDIADLQEVLATSPPDDVATSLTRLLAASENHLQAFTRLDARV